MEYYFNTHFAEDMPEMGYLYTCNLCRKEWESDYGNLMEYDGRFRKHLINDHGFTLQEIEKTVPIYESGLTEE